MILSKESAQQIVDDVSRLIGRDINIMDQSGVIIASTDPARVSQRHEGACRILEERLESLVIEDAAGLSGVRQGINLPLSFQGQVLGVIGITGRPSEVAMFGQVIRRMTEILLETTWRQEQSAQLEQARSLFLESWLFSDAPDETELEARAALLGVDLSLPRSVLVVRPVPRDDAAPWELESGRLLELVRRRIGSDPQSFCAVIRRDILILLGTVAPEDIRALTRHLTDDLEGFFNVRICGGVSSPCTHPSEIHRCYLEARNACKTARLSDRSRFVFYSDSSLDALLQAIPQSMKRRLFQRVFALCAPAERDELLETLRLYFQCEGSVERAAALAFIHKNTFLYRLRKVAERTGCRPRVPQEAMLLYCALRFSEEAEPDR